MAASYRELIVWQKGMDLVESIYDLVSDFPNSERYELSSQMRRAGVSIPSNIAEGRYRGTRKDYRHFLITAFASGAELETQLEICNRIQFGGSQKRLKSQSLLTEVMKMLNSMIDKLDD